MLIDQLASPPFLSFAWERLNKSNPDSSGLSYESISAFRANLHTKIPHISKQLLSNEFQFSPTRAVVIPKDNGNYRPLQIPEVQDRVVLKAMAIILEDELSSELEYGKEVSFAYQKNIGLQDAIEKMLEYYSNGFSYILEADIENFFPTVNRDSLLERIFSKLSDSSINSLIEQGISQPVGGLEFVEQRHHSLFPKIPTGIPQGNALSPLFSNICLSPFDKRFKDEGLSLIRYADDFIVMCKTKSEALKSYEIAKDVLENELGLKLHGLNVGEKPKTKIVDPLTDEFSFLSISFDGENIFPSKKALTRFINTIYSICNSKENATSILKVLQKINNSLGGWISTYSFTDSKRYFEQIDSEINRQLYLSLRKFGWRLTNDSIGSVKPVYKKPKESGDCLSTQQRLNSGVPFCQEIQNFHELRRKKEVKIAV